MMSKRALCLLCGTDLKDGKPAIVDDLRKVVEKWEFRWKNSDQDYTWDCIQEAKKLIGGVMVNCLICGERITSTTTDTLCPTCRRQDYKLSRPTIRQVIPSDCVSKDDLLKLVEDIRADQYESADVNIWYSDGCKHSADRIEELLKEIEKRLKAYDEENK